MAIKPIITRSGEITSKLFGTVNKFDPNNPFKDQRSMAYREVGKMKPMFMLGPHRNSKVVSIGDSWNIGGLNLNSVRDRLIENGMYGILSYIPDEGGTVWGLTPDEALANKEGVLTLDEVIKNDVTGRRWMSAFNNARKEIAKTKTKDKSLFQKIKMRFSGELSNNNIEPFALSFVSSVTLRTLPFFGRTRFSAALDNGVISVVQIPLMNDNKEAYFAWKYVLKDPDSMTKSDFKNEFGAGGENDYELFQKIREFVEGEDCLPMNNEGNYDTTQKEEPKENKEDIEEKENNKEENDSNDDSTKQDNNNSKRNSTGNPLLDAAYGIHPESRSLTEAICQARQITLEEYVTEEDSKLPKGKPYINKLPMESGTPSIGPLY